MTEQEFNKLRFRELANMIFNDGSLTTYTCVSKPLNGRLTVFKWIKRDKQTDMPLDEKPLIRYSLDGRLYQKREKLLETIKRI